VKLLVDGDIVAYRTAMSFEHAIEWEEGLWTLHSDVNECTAEIDNYLNWLLEEVHEASDIIIALTDRDNFRKEICSEYKANRANKRKPLALSGIRDFLEEEYDAIVWPKLEADDVIGILATQKKMINNCIIVSPDKDLLQIPGYHFIDGSLIHRCIEECDQWHMTQSLTGDATDNYKGCPGIGPVKAERLLTPPSGTEPTNEWMWSRVVEAYHKAGLETSDAIDNAQLAHILRYENYPGMRINLWQPPTP